MCVGERRRVGREFTPRVIDCHTVFQATVRVYTQVKGMTAGRVKRLALIAPGNRLNRQQQAP